MKQLKRDFVSSRSSTAERILTYVVQLKWQKSQARADQHSLTNIIRADLLIKMLRNLQTGRVRGHWLHSGLWARPLLPAWCCVQVSARCRRLKWFYFNPPNLPDIPPHIRQSLASCIDSVGSLCVLGHCWSCNAPWSHWFNLALFAFT